MSEIRNAGLMSQITDFSGMQYGLCKPTDIDLSMDFQGKLFVFVELKFKGTGLTRGQKYHLEGLCKAITAGGREAYAILAHHDTPKDEPIMAAEATPASVYILGKWCTPCETTLHELITNIHEGK